MVRLCLILVAASMLTALCLHAHAQSAGASSPHRETYFAQLFNKPTNNNGYEEFVQAVDIIANIDDVDMLTEAGATLAFKRRTLAIPACAQALKLVREGLAKPVGSPRDGIDENTRFPEMQGFRRLARLLMTEQYVDFADGRNAAAIESMRTGLAFGYRIQTDTLISGLVGIAVDAIVLREFAGHFDQLSIYDCDSVFQITKPFLEAENPGIRLLLQEKASILKMLEKRRNDPDGLVGLMSFGAPNDDAAVINAVQQVKNHLAAQPAQLNSLLDAAEAKICALYDKAAANMRLPLSQRKAFVKEDANNPVGALVQSVTVDPQKIIDKYSVDLAKLRLLAVHAIIRRYQWDHNQLPASLTMLHAEDLVVDPFTGDTIIYKREGDLYTLTSVGPFISDDATHEVTSVRNPVRLR